MPSVRVRTAVSWTSSNPPPARSSSLRRWGRGSGSPSALANASTRKGARASTVDASGYAKSVDAVLQEIGAGNVYQANFSQRLSTEAAIDSWRLYRALRAENPE